MAAIWTSQRNACSNSESSCCIDASHQVLVQYDVVWEEIWASTRENLSRPTTSEISVF